MSERKKIAIIGAGLSGLTLANTLRDVYDIEIFEKSRGVGGRMSTRRADPYQFDHGAQYFTARTSAFKDFLKPFIEKQTVQIWHANAVTLDKEGKSNKREWPEPHYVCAPSMNSLCKDLANNQALHLATEISGVQRQDSKWSLLDKNQNSYGGFDGLICSVPSHQAVALLPKNFQYLEDIQNIKMQGCFSLMLGFTEKPTLNFDFAMPTNSPIGWLAVNSNKPDRKTGHSIIVQTTNTWAEEHIEDDLKEVENTLLVELEDLCDIDTSKAELIQTHRWRFANTLNSAEKPFWDDNMNIGVCGDWCTGKRVEQAFTSANILAEQVKKSGL